MPEVERMNPNNIARQTNKRSWMVIAIIVIAIIVVVIVVLGFFLTTNSEEEFLTVDELMKKPLKYDGDTVTVRGYIKKEFKDNYILADVSGNYHVELYFFLGDLDLDKYTYIEVTGEFHYYESIDSTLYLDYYKVLD